MITDALISFFFWLVGVVLDALPDWDVPTWLSASGPMGTVFTYAGQMGAWFPTTLAVTVLGAVAGAWAIAFGIKLARIVASFMTMGGGSAA